MVSLVSAASNSSGITLFLLYTFHCFKCSHGQAYMFAVAFPGKCTPLARGLDLSPEFQSVLTDS